MKYEEVGKVVIRGSRWSYGWGDAGVYKGKDCEGKCDYGKRRIIIDPRHFTNLIDVSAREVLHAYFPEYKEETINEVAEKIALVYSKLCIGSPRHGG
jgi:hypothetical protein